MAVLRTLGYELEPAVRAVEGFEGTVRRFELHGVERGVSVFDDYAHHPTEVAAALAAARTVVGDGRIIAVHQPHTYSRTQHMFREFAEVLESHADHTIVLDVYGAREDPIPGRDRRTGLRCLRRSRSRALRVGLAGCGGLHRRRRPRRRLRHHARLRQRLPDHPQVLGALERTAPVARASASRGTGD